MRAVIQRVTSASVEIEDGVKSQIGKGLLILLGVEESDTSEDVQWLTRKIASMRIFQDEYDKMNLSILDVKGEALVVSQFTLHASTKKGNRPSFIRAARPETAIPLYKFFVQSLKQNIENKVGTGTFGAYMQVSLVNDGPVTIIVDSKNRE